MQEDGSLENKATEGKKPFKFSFGQLKQIKAFKVASCNISEACRIAGCTRMAFYKNLNECPPFRENIEAIQEAELDFAESQLKFLMTGQFIYKRRKDSEGKDIPVKNWKGEVIPNQFELELDALGNPIRDYIIPIDNASVIFKLKTHGKKRDYTYRTEITGAEGKPLGGFKIKIGRKNKD